MITLDNLTYFFRDLLFHDWNEMAMEEEKQAVEDFKTNFVWQFCSVVTWVL